MPAPRALRATLALIAAAILLAAPPASARDVRDGSTGFRLSVQERGPACVLAPGEEYDEKACATITTRRPDDVAAAHRSPRVTLLGAFVVRAPDFAYAVDVLREPRASAPELVDLRPDDVARLFVTAMQPSLAAAGASAHVEGAADLAITHDVPVISFEYRATMEAGPVPDVDCTETALVLADGYTYTLEVRGPSARSADLRALTHAAIDSLQATPPKPSAAFERGAEAVRAAAVVLPFAVAAIVLLARRRARAKRS
jgi:hypothetical protein